MAAAAIPTLECALAGSDALLLSEQIEIPLREVFARKQEERSYHLSEVQK